ncbi:MAG: hypothetical protein KME60_28440 [Cyanomargarita calcarea GSE-NOS-MK-12-04C]|jgi:hypothetical protein|uniref:Uncharacterized protein n=1 Tax=Cyanomargarita calcarea GSE-NOS-MK-12-04C TaxID=2839659 RepID=A0A951QV07_9CYAN|nr:hypothetical protein [Cyanomargarita calcarea GSE-NOS-MK-12-04C]
MTSEMKQALWINPSKFAVELTFTTNPQDVNSCDSDISERGLTECWVKFPEFLLNACRDFQQTPEGAKFLDLLADMTRGYFDPEVIYWTISEHQANPFKLVASRRCITSAFGVTKINNKYITAISVPQENEVYVWFIIITHDNLLETSLDIAYIFLYDIGILINGVLSNICHACNDLIIFIGSIIQKFIDCLSVLFILILTIIGGLIMPLNLKTEPRDRPISQFRAFNLIYRILDFLQEISQKLTDLEEVNDKLTRLDENVAYLNSSSEIIMQNINEIHNASLMDRYEEIIRENQNLENIQNILQKQLEMKDKIIARQKEYIEKLADEIEQASKIISSKQGDNKKSTTEQLTELFQSLKDIPGQTTNFISQVTNDLRESNLKGILNLGGTHSGNQKGNEHNSQPPNQT